MRQLLMFQGLSHKLVLPGLLLGDEEAIFELVGAPWPSTRSSSKSRGLAKVAALTHPPLGCRQSKCGLTGGGGGSSIIHTLGPARMSVSGASAKIAKNEITACPSAHPTVGYLFSAWQQYVNPAETHTSLANLLLYRVSLVQSLPQLAGFSADK